jgi:DNA polymerase III subunit delta
LKIQTLEELENCLRDAGMRICMILGPELYQCQIALDLIKRTVVEGAALAFDYSEFRAGEDSLDQILQAANTFPMMSPKRLVLVREADNLPDSDLDALLDSLDGLSSRSMLVFFAEEFDHRKRFYRALQDKYCVVEFPKLKDAALEQWAASFIRKQGFRISTSAVKKIVALAGSDLQMLAAEMEKLLLYAGKEKDIIDDAVDNLISGSRQQGIFKLIDAVAQGDQNEALRALANLLGMGEPPLRIVTMMARHCRQVLITKDCIARGINAREIAGAAQIPPFMLDRFVREARAADAAKIQAMHVRLAEIDKRLKSSSPDGRILLERLICAFV